MHDALSYDGNRQMSRFCSILFVWCVVEQNLLAKFLSNRNQRQKNENGNTYNAEIIDHRVLSGNGVLWVQCTKGFFRFLVTNQSQPLPFQDRISFPYHKPNNNKIDAAFLFRTYIWHSRPRALHAFVSIRTGILCTVDYFTIGHTIFISHQLFACISIVFLPCSRMNHKAEEENSRSFVLFFHNHRQFCFFFRVCVCVFAVNKLNLFQSERLFLLAAMKSHSERSPWRKYFLGKRFENKWI